MEFLRNVFYKVIVFVVCGLVFLLIAGVLNRYLMASFLSDNMVVLISLLFAATYVLFKVDIKPMEKENNKTEQ
jgi:uncharacterized membrane protein YjdF